MSWRRKNVLFENNTNQEGENGLKKWIKKKNILKHLYVYINITRLLFIYLFISFFFNLWIHSMH